MQLAHSRVHAPASLWMSMKVAPLIHSRATVSSSAHTHRVARHPTPRTLWSRRLATLPFLSCALRRRRLRASEALRRARMVASTRRPSRAAREAQAGAAAKAELPAVHESVAAGEAARPALQRAQAGATVLNSTAAVLSRTPATSARPSAAAARARVDTANPRTSAWSESGGTSVNGSSSGSTNSSGGSDNRRRPLRRRPAAITTPS
mmetsp:Transcript_4907/g.11186  ORF Transcript_4907/g.11186 Transcript_4907/m.11186 type:complete len:207 (+) Transcript_4907:370-990(+)